MDVEELEKIEGIGPTQIKALKNEGITTVEYLASFSRRELMEVKGIGEEKAAKLSDIALKHVQPKMFVTASDIYEQQKDLEYLTTGSTKFNELLGKGIETKGITEIAGPYSSGKTQICHELCVNAQLPKEQGGLEAGVLYHDVENTFQPQRLFQIAEANELDPEEVGKNIVVAQCYSTDHQIFCMNQSDKIIRENNVRLIIVDGVMSHWRSEFIGRENLAERQQQLNQYLNKLKSLARAHNAVAFITNQIVSNPNATFYGPSEVAIGGNILAHNANTRLWIRRPNDMKPKRIVKLYKNAKLPTGQTVILITEKGIEDVPDSEQDS